MDVYGMPSSDFTSVDELLDFSNDHCDVLCASATDILHQHQKITSSTTNGCHVNYISNYDDDIATNYHHHSKDFTDDLSVPSDDVAELEWLSNFVHDSFSNFPANNMAGTINYRSENTSYQSGSRSKRTRALTNNTISENLQMKLETYSPATSSSSDKSSETGTLVRRCTHCASEKTPQWRTGPLGPKTLCNACGVRYKSGRLVPEYRPAASPTFVLTQHSNSHRKVMELRQQKEMMQLYGGEYHNHHHNNNYEVRRCHHL